jgi:hypothetical protein
MASVFEHYRRMEYLVDSQYLYGDNNMTTIDKLDDDKVAQIANSLGYDLKKSKKTEEKKPLIVELDLWDVSEILFS